MTEQQSETSVPMQSDDIGELANAVCKMQMSTLFAITDAVNPFFKNRYTTLSSVWAAIRTPLTSNELAIIQTTEPYENGVTVVTTLMHSSGQWIKGRLSGEIVPDKKGVRNPQGLLSLITYLRRAGVSAIVGVCPSDDDGESCVDRSEPLPPDTQKKTAPAPKLDADEHAKINYTMPGEDSFAMQQLKEYHPDATILNEEKTHFKVGKFTAEISEDGNQIWVDAPKFGKPDFNEDACVPCLIAALVRAHGVPFVEGKYQISFTSEAKKNADN